MWESKKFLKQVEVKAIQYNGTNRSEVVELAYNCAEVLVALPNHVFVLSLFKETMFVELNDWLVKETDGKFYIVKPKMFNMEYDEVV